MSFTSRLPRLLVLLALAGCEREVSFSQDVMPIFKVSCSLSSCHGGGSGGLEITADDPEKTWAAMVNVAATALPTFKYVVPGDPANSFLLRKVDGDLAPLAAQCLEGDCGVQMPEGGFPLEDDERETIRLWIAQGAKAD